MGIINGYQNPRFTILNNGTLTAVIDLPLTNSEGLVEKYDIRKLEHELLNYSIASRIEGFKITWTLNYDEYVTGESLMLIRQVFEYAKQGYKLFLTPRIEHPWRAFEVYVSMDNFELGIRRGGIAAKAHRQVVLEFATVNIEPDLKWYDANHIPVLTHVCNESIKFII